MRNQVIAAVFSVVLLFGVGSANAGGLGVASANPSGTSCSSQGASYIATFFSSLEGVIVHIFGGTPTLTSTSIEPLCGVIVH